MIYIIIIITLIIVLFIFISINIGLKQKIEELESLKDKEDEKAESDYIRHIERHL